MVCFITVDKLGVVWIPALKVCIVGFGAGDVGAVCALKIVALGCETDDQLVCAVDICVLTDERANVVSPLEDFRVGFDADVKLGVLYVLEPFAPGFVTEYQLDVVR